MVRFDAYSATTTAANHYQLADLFGPGLTSYEGRGFHSFGHRLSLKDESGSEVGSVQWGGRHGERSMIEVKGERSPEVVERLRGAFPHRTTRMDSCADFDAPGAFDRLLGACMAVKAKHRLKGERKGDWQDFPELGRTQYLGTPQSVSMLRLYEKGRQPEYRHLGRNDWVRAEIQVRPAKEAKTEFSKLSALDAWGASAWSRDLAGEILREHIDPHPAGTVYRKTSLDARLDWLCRQGGSTLLELYEAVGTWECVGLTLSEKIKELRDA
jgi:hypothetical protein